MSESTDGRTAGVVVPAVTAPSSVTCVRSLGRRGIHTIVASARGTAAASRSRYCDETVSVPSPHDDLLAYKDALRALAKRSDVATVVPVREQDIYVLSKYREEFAPHIGTPWPTFETLRRVQDRVALFDTAVEAGVEIPVTHRLSDTDHFGDDKIVKARYSLLADEYVEDYSPQQCRPVPGTTYVAADETPDSETLRAEMGHDPIVQEYLPSTDEYGFFAFYKDGEAVSTFQHRQVRGYNYNGGPSAYRESVDIPALAEAGTALLDALEWHGVAMVEFLRDESTGEFKLMEVNPRFWSSLPFTVQTGADFPYYYWLAAQDNHDEIQTDYEVEIAGHLLRGELSYLHSVQFDDVPLVSRPDFATAVTAVLSSLYRHPRFDYLQPEDPLPFLQDIYNSAQLLAGFR